MFGDMGKMMKQVAEMKTKMAAVEKELANLIVPGESKDTSVKIEITGKMKFKKITLADNFPKDVKGQEKVIGEALEKALNDVSNIAQEKLKAVTGGIKIPGL